MGAQRRKISSLCPPLLKRLLIEKEDLHGRDSAILWCDSHRNCGNRRHLHRHRTYLPHVHKRASVQPHLENNRSAIRDFYNCGLGIRIPSHASRPQEFERSRVHRGKRAILRVRVRSHTLFLELARHQQGCERLYRGQRRRPVAGMDYL